MENKAVFDTGPIIHLSEINFIKSLEIFSNIFTSKDVAEELKRYNFNMPKKAKVINLTSPNSKNNVKVFTNIYDLDIGEASAIAVAIQERIKIFLTDDLDARHVAKQHSLEAHGSIGIILRAFRNKIIDKKNTVNKIKELYSKSSLFLTKDLVDEVLESIEEF